MPPRAGPARAPQVETGDGRCTTPPGQRSIAALSAKPRLIGMPLPHGPRRTSLGPCSRAARSRRLLASSGPSRPAKRKSGIRGRARPGSVNVAIDPAGRARLSAMTPIATSIDTAGPVFAGRERHADEDASSSAPCAASTSQWRRPSIPIGRRPWATPWQPENCLRTRGPGNHRAQAPRGTAPKRTEARMPRQRAGASFPPVERLWRGRYSKVTDFARLRGWSTSVPLRIAVW